MNACTLGGEATLVSSDTAEAEVQREQALPRIDLDPERPLSVH